MTKLESNCARISFSNLICPTKVSSIPVGPDPPGDAARTKYTAAPSRLNIDLRSPWPFGTLRTFVEADFAGDGAAARLRHAYMQTSRWLFGQTWSTFDDPEAQPTELDFEGLNAISRFRQAQIRYNRDLRDGLNLALAIEDPAPDLTGARGVNLTPDVTARLRWQFDAAARGADPSHLHIAVLARSLRGDLTTADGGNGGTQSTDTLTTGGFGVNLSGVLAAPWSRADRIRFGTNDGWGIGRYISDLRSLGGQDGVFDPETRQLHPLDVYSGYIGYEHWWAAQFRSSISFGIVGVTNLDSQPDDALHRTQRSSINFMWSPIPRLDLVTEFLWGRRTNKNGRRAFAAQTQIGSTFRF